MKYTLTKRDIGILMGFLGIVILGLTYYFIYYGYSGKTEELQAANTAMQARVDVLQDLVNRQDELVQNTQKYNDEADTIMSKFPADYWYEDAILYGIELIDVAPLEDLSAISFEDEQTVYTFADIDAAANEKVRGYIPDGGVPAPAPEGEATQEQEAAPAPAEAVATPELKSKAITYVNKTDYNGFKNALAYVVNRAERSGLNVNAVYDDTEGLINDSISVSSYYVVNNQKTYKEPEMPIVVKGTDDIFGTTSIGVSPSRGRMSNNEGNNNDSQSTGE